MIEWWKKNIELHGWAILFLGPLVYMSQGGRSYVTTTMDQIIQYGFNAKPAQAAGAKAIGKIPWNFKFVYGLISDNLPLLGYNVKVWLFLFALLGLVSQTIMGFEQLSPSVGVLTLSYTLLQFYGAASDCLSDALIVKSGNTDEEDGSSGLQSLSWFSFGFGGAFFTLLGSYLVSDDSEDGVNVQGARLFNKIMIFFPAALLLFVFFIKEQKTSISFSLKTLLQQFVRLFVAFASPPFIVLRVMFWIFVSNSTIIDMSSGAYPFITNILKISIATQGYIAVAQNCFLMIGVVIYYRFFRHTSFRVIFAVSQVLLAATTFLDYALFRGWNRVIGIPDVWFLAGSGAFGEIIGRLNAMPFLVMAGQLCPKNMEATFFALLMSISNQGGNVADIFATKLFSAYDVTEETIDGLGMCYLWKMGLLLAVLPLIFLVPNTSSLDPTNVESLHPTNPYIVRLLQFADMYHPEIEEKIKQEKANV
jgi:hypothetical protein